MRWLEAASGGAGVETILCTVEQGIAPERVIATKPAGLFTPVITRPLCPFPKQERYGGTGRTNLASNFTCVVDTTNANHVPAPSTNNRSSGLCGIRTAWIDATPAEPCERGAKTFDS